MSKIEDERILQLVGYRIPTEGKYSMVPMRVKRFLPREAGGTVMLPLEITAITGSDFDIDKMYIMLSALVSENNELNRVEFLTNKNSSVEERYAKYIDSLIYSLFTSFFNRVTFNSKLTFISTVRSI